MGLNTTVLRVVQHDDNSFVTPTDTEKDVNYTLIRCDHEPYDRYITVTIQEALFYGLGFTQTIGKNVTSMLLLSRDINRISDFVGDVNEQTLDRTVVSFNASVVQQVANKNIKLPNSIVEKLVQSGDVVVAVMNPRTLIDMSPQV